MLLLGRIVAALISGALLAQAHSLHPLWLLAWIAPIPVLIAIIGASRLGAALYGAIAGGLSIALMFTYLSELNGIVPTLAIMLIKALIWSGMAVAVHAAARHLPPAAAVFVFPTLMAGVETLQTAVSPHGAASSLAYSQMDFLPAIQIASLGGAPAITFTITLFACSIAFLLAKRAVIAAIAPAVLVGAVFAYGSFRVPAASGDASHNAVLIAADQFEGIPEDWRSVWNGYTPQIERAADRGLRIVVLPEKVAHLEPGERAAAIEQLAEIARRRDLLLVAGVDDEADDGRFNRAFVFTRDGWQSYDKRHMIPGFESHFDLGAGPLVFEHEGLRYGVAICKDMDFPALGREYAGVDVMLVPAWDFSEDAWLHSRMAILRGVENGYTIVRSARNGVLTVSDGYGYVSAEAPSGPQTAFNAAVPSRDPGPTLYSRIGDAFGWSMLALASILIAWIIWARSRAGQSE
ncbi:MAG: nitrilase-related carbon-nitrogen hydrolase [Caulobacteraceae bacterium]